MFLEHWEKIIFSIIWGLFFGIADAVSFLYIAKLFLNAQKGKIKAIAGSLELFKLIFLVIMAIVIFKNFKIFILVFILSAVFISVIGKLVFIFKNIKAINN
jgi:hypothetical protein